MTATTVQPRAAQPAVAATAAPAAPPIGAIIVAIVITLVVVNMVIIRMEPHLLNIVRYDQQPTPARIIEYLDAPTPDVLFMGTSRAFSGFDPSVAEAEIKRATGTDIYAHNLGIGGGTIEIHYLILKNIIREEKKPKVIVYGLTEIELADLRANPLEYLPYVNILLRPDDFSRFSGESLDSKVDFWANQALPLYRDRRIIATAMSIALNPYDPYHKYFARGPERRVPPANGFSPGSGNTQAPAAQLAQNRTEYTPLLADFRFSYKRLQLFHDFFTLANSRGIKVVLVNMPVNDEMRALWSSEARINEYRAMVQLVAADNGVPVLDLYHGSEAVPADGFWDWHHLNEVGAAVVTRFVARNYLQELFGGEAVSPTATSVDLPRPASPALSAARPGPQRNRAVVEALFPATIELGEGFNVQPDGQSAIAIKASNVSNSSIIVFGGMRLETNRNADGILTAKVPAELIASPGQYPVVVSDGETDSNTLYFEVRAPGEAPGSAPPVATTARPAAAVGTPQIEALFPDGIAAGEGFNIQPDGQSAIAIKTTNVTSSGVIVFAGTRLDTTINADGVLTAKVPAEMTASPGQYPVVVSDGGTDSNTVYFEVRAP